MPASVVKMLRKAQDLQTNISINMNFTAMFRTGAQRKSQDNSLPPLLPQRPLPPQASVTLAAHLPLQMSCSSLRMLRSEPQRQRQGRPQPRLLNLRGVAPGRENS